MKFFSSQQRSAKGRPAGGEQAWTIAEMMVAMGLFSLVVIATVYAFMFGMRYDELVGSKLGASDNSRKSFDQLVRDIRTAKSYLIGVGSASSFASVSTNNAIQQGNALQLCLNDDLRYSTNPAYIVYYFDTSDANNYKLCRRHSGVTGSTVISSNLINTLNFTAENYQGITQSNLTYKNVIHTTLQFCQYQYPLTKVGAGYLYNFYKIEFRATPHCPY
jgi:Tfp pilus assembly protein PilW